MEDFILIENVAATDLEIILTNLSNLYVNTGFTKEINLFKNNSTANQFLITFTNPPDLDHFAFFVNYLNYPEGFDKINPVLKGFYCLKKTDMVKEFKSGDWLQLYVSKNDNAYDNVNIVTSANESFLFDFGGKIKQLPFSEEHYHLPLVDKEAYSLLKQISPSEEEQKKSSKPWWKFFIFIVITGLISCNNSKQQSSSNATGTPSDTIAFKMTDSIKSDMLEDVQRMVSNGFYTADEITVNFDDAYIEYPYDHQWIKTAIEKAYAKKIQEQQSWPLETDFDKLAKAFDQLNRSGIIALHNAGYTKSDAETDCRDKYDTLKQKGIIASGYCYYHGQDIERAVDDAGLFIGFGDFNNNEAAAITIGKKVAAVLQQNGFKLNWDNTVYNRIEITNMHWQKRFGNSNCSYERAMELLLNTKKQ